MFGDAKEKTLQELRAQLAQIKADMALAQNLRKAEESLRVLKEEVAAVKVAALHRHADELLMRNGLLFTSVTNTYDILDYTGKTRMKRKCEGLRAIGDCTAVCIPHMIGASTPEATFLSGPELIGASNGCALRALWGEDKQMRRFEIGFKPPLQKESKPLSYTFGADVHAAFFMAREDLEKWNAKNEDTDYRGEPDGENVAFDVNYPVGELSLHVSFPKGYVVKSTSAGAYFIRETWQTHLRESERIANLLKISEGELTLTVPRPVLGFRYAIHWMPLDRAQLEELLKLDD